MSELSNALRQRLASGEEPRVHPDADTLTAYVEQLLPATERSQVLEHLAGCRHCRDVVAFSLPPETVAEDRIAAVAVPARSGRRIWRWRPAWGLAASLAGLAIVSAVILELPRGPLSKQAGPKQAGQPAVSSPANTTPAVAPAQPEMAATQPAPTPSSAISVTFAETWAGSPVAKSAPPVETAAATTITVRSTPKTAGAGVAEPYVNVQMFSNDAASAGTAGVDLPSAPMPHISVDRAPSASVLGGAAQLTARADVPHETQSPKPLRILAPPASSNHFGLVRTLGRDARQLFQRPAPAIRPNAFSTSAMGGAGQFMPKELGPSPEITAAAPLAGKDAADLEQSHAFTLRALADSSAGRMESVDGRAKTPAGVPTAWKVSDGKLLKLSDSGAWTQASADESIEFSVVSSHGSDIWAGGSSAALIHSRDGGAIWERITLGASATGAITRIEASGLKVLVRSSSGQSWFTADGGKTWVLQD